ncbi:hypothetical protein SLS57_012066 [Botryosphaeria dothidea]
MSKTLNDLERPSYEILLDEPPSLKGNTDAIDEARQLYSIYLAHRDKNGSTDPRGTLLPFFIYQYDKEATEDDDAIGTINLKDRRLPSLEALTGIQKKTSTSSDSRFRIDYVGVFYPDLTTEAAAVSNVTTQGSTVIFRDVDLFLDSAQQAGYTHGNGLIAQHLHLCLRGSAATWYATVDIPTKRQLAEDIHL